MTSQINPKITAKPADEAVVHSGKPPYPFRTAVALLLLAGNFLVAAIYFHVVNP
ncbi:MAG TPA: photosystem I protein PsaX [Candidatus Caenarcaniphilales bacterium]